MAINYYFSVKKLFIMIHYNINSLEQVYVQLLALGHYKILFTLDKLGYA